MQESRQHRGDVAVLGMACRFPGADGYRQFWRLLAQGGDSIREIPAERWRAGDFYSRDLGAANAAVSKWGGFLDRVDEFDNRFFSISAREARAMDPRQRVLLEEVWRALEDSALPLESLRSGKTAVYVGMMSLGEGPVAAAVDGYAGSGGAGCMLANRVSHFFDFHGPSLSIDTASSSSLVALHQAKEALRSGEADYAVVAGVSLNLTPWKYISFSKARMLSPGGRCKAFDRSADGYAPGEGVGVLVLQRADRASADRNFVHGLVRGSAVNHGGLAVSLTAPQVASQRDVIGQALADSGVSPGALTYVEAHGSGTPLGDPIEVEALIQAFRQGTDAEQFCHLGSVKTNIGHLEPAAGIAGVIKVLLMMRHRLVPASLHLRELNPMLDLRSSPFKLVDRLTPWTGDHGPLLAGVSSFGFGGVNSHVVIESAPAPAPGAGEDDSLCLPFALSARTPASLQGLVESWLGFVKTEEFERASWRDICGTLLGRRAFDCRAAWWVSKRGLEEALRGAREPPLPAGTQCLALGSSADFERGQVEELAGSIAFAGVQWSQICGGIAQVMGEREGREAAEFSARFWDNRPALWDLVVGLLLARMARAWLPGVGVVTGEGMGLQAALCASGMLGEPAALRRAAGLAEPSGPALVRPTLAFFDPALGRTLWPVEIPANYLPELFAKAALSPSDERDLIRRAGELAAHQPTFRKFLDRWQAPLEQAGVDLPGLLGGAGAEPAGPEPGGRLSIAALVSGDCLRRLNIKWDLGLRGLPPQPFFLEALALLGAGLAEPRELVRFLTAGEGQAAELAEAATVRARGMKGADPFPFLASLLRQPLGGEAPSPVADFHPLPPGLFASNLVVRVGKLRNHAPSGLSLLEPGPRLADQLGLSLVAAWRSGAAVSWERTPWTADSSRMPLPTYCFDRSRFEGETAQAPLLPDLAQADEGAAGAGELAAIERLQARMKEMLVGILRVERGEIDDTADLREHGMESVALADFAEGIGRSYGMELDPVLLYGHRNLRSLARYLVTTYPSKFCEGAAAAPPSGAAAPPPPAQAAEPGAEGRLATAEDAPGEVPPSAVAIIGMACRFPKASTPAQFWENLAGEGISSRRCPRADGAGRIISAIRTAARTRPCPGGEGSWKTPTALTRGSSRFPRGRPS